MRERAKYERMRVLAYTTYLAIPEKKHKKSMQAFMPFPWDKKGKTSGSLAELYKQRQEHIKQFKELEEKHKAA